jgi:hypothetical protein
LLWGANGGDYPATGIDLDFLYLLVAGTASVIAFPSPLNVGSRAPSVFSRATALFEAPSVTVLPATTDLAVRLERK